MTSGKMSTRFQLVLYIGVFGICDLSKVGVMYMYNNAI